LKPYSIDDWWELLKLKYERLDRPVPRRWNFFYRRVRGIIAWGAR